MTTTEIPTPTRQDLYLEVLQHYARQMRLLDDRQLAAYADTFTDDAVFDHGAGGEPARTRAGILALLEEFHRQFESDPQQRRHHFSMVDVEPQADGTLHTTCYALVLLIRPGEQAEVRSSCVVRDVLVRDETGLRNRSRLVTIDGRQP
jgi:actinorhodin biosynthesis protein ActVIA